ncbi:GGDEF domain-containing response regulator [Thiovibrio sp. JS02]
MAILIVDDTPVNLMLLEEMLQEEGYAPIHCVRSGEDALALLAEAARVEAAPERIDLILMDVMMPGMDGIETCRRLKAQEHSRDIPVIMVTVRDDEEALAQAFAIGAIDYIVKPVREVELLARVRSALKLKEEIERRKERERELVELARQLDTINRRLMRLVQIDDLTEIGNRRYFEEILIKEWNRARRDGVPLSLIMIDVDDFKAFSERYGQRKGDECLQLVAGALSCVLKRAGDTVVRYGGEEFAVILPNTANDGALAVAGEFRKNVAALNIRHEGGENGGLLTVSIGLATASPARCSDMQGLLAAADGALYLARSEGRNRIKIALECS